MSTRITLWYSDEYHLYQDGFDEQNVYLDIKSTQFDSLILKIPLAAWKEMRQHTIEPNERYLSLSDEELRAEAEREVDDHREYLDSLGDSRFKSMAGMLIYGPAEGSREDMIERFLTYYRPGMFPETAVSNE